jgi:flagellar biosynthetic protein FliR
MPLMMVELLMALPIFAMVLFRITGLMLTAPVLGSRMIPMRIRAAFALALGAMLFPIVRSQAPTDGGMAAVITGGLGELIVGAGIGLSLTIMLTLAEVVGVLVSQQAGVALADVIDPTRGEQVSVISQLYATCIGLLFLAVGGLRAAVAALMDTFAVVPLWTFDNTESVLVLLVEILSSAFIVGVRLAGPVLIALFLSGLGMGLLSRTIPQMNILTVGFTLRALIGLGVAGMALAASHDVIVNAIVQMVETTRGAFGLDPLNTRLTI